MAGISAKQVKELRDKTGAGMMDCKKALSETEGDVEKAVDYLRKKGLASAGKKSGRLASEGLVDSYIHFGGQIGVMVEVNCETDFVARNDAFKGLVQDIAKQIAACPNVVYVKLDDIPEAIREQEKQIAMGSDTLKGKPDNIKEKIVQGKLDKTLRELCLLDQAYIKDQSITVEELIKQTVATLGENIQVRRFSRFILGEGLEKKESSLAEEVAAQMGTKSEAPASTADSPVTETKTESPAEGATGKTEVPAQTKKDGFATTPPKEKAKKKGKSKKKGK